MQAMQDYRRTQFGGWKFQDAAPVHGSAPERFARYPDGREEKPAETTAAAS
jgi:quercetin 2,3-dioxygenase